MAFGRERLDARWAVSLLFLANGAVVGAWVPHIPERARTLGLNTAQLGTALLAGGLGAVIAMPMASALIRRFGSRRVCAVAGSMFALMMAAAVLAPGVAWMVGALLLFGFAGASMDIAMNAQGVLVEAERRRPLISSFHGVYSLGGMLGSAGTSAALARGLSGRTAAVGTALVLAMLVLFGQSGLLPDAPGEPGSGEEWPEGGEGLRRGGEGLRAGEERATGGAVARAWRHPRLLGLGLLVFSAMITEGAVADWSAVFLRVVRGYGAGAAGLGFAGFSAAMLVGRLLGDQVVMRMGEARTLRVGGLLAAAGLLLILWRGETEAAVAGFAMLGLGLANCSPVLYRAAAHVKGLPAGAGLATSVGIGYAGLLLGPPLLGYLGKMSGVPSIFVAMAVLCGALAMASPLVRRSA